MKSLLFCLLSSVTVFAAAPDGLGDIPAQQDISLIIRMSDLGLDVNTVQQNGISSLSEPTTSNGSNVFASPSELYQSPTNTSAWASFDRRHDHHDDDDDGCHPSPVPEPATYGFILTSMTLGVFVWRKRKKQA